MRGRRSPNPARKPSQLLSQAGCCSEVAGAGVAVLVPSRGLGTAHGIPLAGAAALPRGLERGGQLRCVPCTVERSTVRAGAGELHRVSKVTTINVCSRLCSDLSRRSREEKCL